MRDIGLTLLVLAASACGNDVGSRPAVHGDVERTAAIYAAVIDEANEHYKPEWIVAGICQQANEIKMGDCAPMGPELQAALRRDLGKPYTFISDPEEKQGDIFKGKGGVIHWVGPIDGSDDRVTVPTSYYCGGLCAGGKVAVVENRNGAWTVTGSEGSSWIS